MKKIYIYLKFKFIYNIKKIIKYNHYKIFKKTIEYL